MPSRTPSSLRDCSTVRLAATSSIRTDSVISSERRWGLSPESARVVATSSLRWAAPIWRADRLTATLSGGRGSRSEEHTSELQSHSDLVCRLLLEKKNTSRQAQQRAPHVR